MKNIVKVLRPLGVTPLYKGFRQLVYALSLALSNEADSSLTAKELYEATAAYFCCDWRSVERNIRTLAKHAWEINPSYVCRIAGRELHAAPSSAQFISMLYSYIQHSSQLI